jgi:hypothetical protein
MSDRLRIAEAICFRRKTAISIRANVRLSGPFSIGTQGRFGAEMQVVFTGVRKDWRAAEVSVAPSEAV